jgi:uncharacterized membrane protein HdeD (DUF308 family)
MYWLLAGIVYAAAGAIILYDPVLASLTLSLTVGVFLMISGIMRMWAGFHAQSMAGWRWIAAAGAVTFLVGLVVVMAWPGIGLWFLGAMLVVDLIFQGWGLVFLGLSLRSRATRHADAPAAAVQP